KVGDTSAPVHDIGGYDGLGRAGVQTGGTSTTMVRSPRIVFQLQIYDQFGNKIKGTHLLGKQITMLPDPSQTTFCSPSLVQHRSRIYKGPPVDLPYFLGDKLL